MRISIWRSASEKTTQNPVGNAAKGLDSSQESGPGTWPAYVQPLSLREIQAEGTQITQVSLWVRPRVSGQPHPWPEGVWTATAPEEGRLETAVRTENRRCPLTRQLDSCQSVVRTYPHVGEVVPV